MGKIVKEVLIFFCVHLSEKGKYICVCVCVCSILYFLLTIVLFKHFEVLGYQYLLQFSIYFNYMNLYAQGP